MKILIVDDEKLLVKGIKFSLEQEGFETVVAYDGEEALNLIHDDSISLIILDLMLPKIDGFTVCQRIREFSSIPVIMLTAKSDDIDKIMGLEYGADDYLTKPFNILELKARVKAILRRFSGRDDSKRKPENKEIYLDFNTRKIHIENRTIELTSKEFDLLELFLSNRGKVYTREGLLSAIWGADYSGDSRTVDVHVRRLREKIEKDPNSPVYINTKWGVGYYFKQN